MALRRPSPGAAHATGCGSSVAVLGHLAYQTDQNGQNGTVLATFAYDSRGVPASVQVGSDPNSAPRYSYVYNGHGDVVALVDAQGTVVASYSYDAFGQLTSFSETFGGTTTWTNPYLYDGRDGVRYDGETGLYWLCVRAYDPSLGRFLARDPLNRAPLFFSDQPYVYAGNNPLINVDPSGQRLVSGGSARTHTSAAGSGGRGRMRPSGWSHRSAGAPADLTVCLSGHVYTLDNALRTGFRQRFQEDFFKAYGPGWPWPMGQAEADFTGYLLGSHRIPRSAYWSTVDGGLISDMWHAAYTRQHCGRGHQGLTLLWLRFIANPGVATFWTAHNNSIFVHTFEAAGRTALSRETFNERRFINITLVMLLMVQYAQTYHSNISQLAALCNPNTICLRILADNYYPYHYPVNSGWFGTWYGFILTRMSCLAPVLSGVC